MNRETRYIVKKDGVVLSERVNDKSKYLELIHGYKRLSPYGEKRKEQYNDYLNSTDKLECLILGSHSDMGQYVETYYKEKEVG